MISLENEAANQTLLPLLVPDTGDDSKIELIAWNAEEGEFVKEGQEICELVTDKASFPIESPQSGILSKILVPAGSEVKTGQEIALLSKAAETQS